MIKEICKQIDKSISKKIRNNDELLSLIMKVISDEKKYPKKLVQLCYDIHEEDTDTGESEIVSKENNLKLPDEFVTSLERLKKQYINFW